VQGLVGEVHNTLHRGAIKIHKTTTDANGDACVPNLQFGDYTVKETAAPTGYRINDTTTHTSSRGTYTCTVWLTRNSAMGRPDGGAGGLSFFFYMGCCLP
jgi:hypothetical protein